MADWFHLKDRQTTDGGIRLQVDNGTLRVQQSTRDDNFADIFSNSASGVFVTKVSDFPAAINGVITLEDNKTYFLLNSVDLLGARLVGGRNSVLVGGSSENCVLSSTGLSSGTALVSSEWSLPCRFLALSHDLALDLDATSNADQAIDWFGVNFLNCATIGTIKSYNNVILTGSAWLNSEDLTCDGTVGTFALEQCLVQAFNGGSGIILPATLTLTRRFRMIYSAVVAGSGSTGINASTSATIPVESYILDTVNFSGAGTATAGLTFDDNKSSWNNCIGVTNSSSSGHLYMQANATATVIAATGTPVKVAGTTTEGPSTVKFSHTDNRLTYTGALVRRFRVTAICSFSSGANNQVGTYVAKNGTVIDDSETYATANTSGRLENVVVQTIVDLEENDYVEIFVENNTSTTNITVEAMSVIVSVSI